MLSLLQELPWWVTILILVREWGITALRFFVIRYGVIPASRGGKLKTVVQTAAIFLYVLPLASLAPWLGVVAFVVMMAALAITLWTGGEYVIEALKLRAAGIRAEKQRFKGEQAMNQPDPVLHPNLHPNLHRLAEQAVTGALGRGLTAATAESLTAGMVTAVLADTPGASGMLQGGVVSYANTVKADVLGVPASCSTPSAPWTARSPQPWPTGRAASAAPTSACPPPAWPVPNRTTAKRWARSSSASPRRKDRRRTPIPLTAAAPRSARLACGAALERLLEALSSEGYRA